MLEKLFNNNPLGVIVLCGSIIGTGYIMSYRLDSIDSTQKTMASDIRTMQGDISNLKSDVAVLKATK